jgi:hypothetical protein
VSEERLAVHTTRTENSERIAVIGGGIAGLFCAYVLANDGHKVELFESSDVLGGRIRSFRFNPQLLNKIEREDPGPIKDEAILETALRADLLASSSMPSPTMTASTDQSVSSKKEVSSDTGSGAPNAEPGREKTSTTTPIGGPCSEGGSEDDYDKRLWDQLEFNAEFGPMRIELEVQRMLAFLLRRLKIPPMNAPPPQGDVTAYDLVRMQRFPAFSSPSAAGDPVYDLRPEEDGKNPLELLKLGVCRAVVDLHFDKKQAPLNDENDPETKKHNKFEKIHDDLIEKLGKAAATQRPSAPVFESWLRNHLHEDDYWIIQRYGQVPVLYGAEKYIKLHTMGFWNLMAAYLSHNALSKVRELGSFYHLIPENPNAAEWLTWWMRQFSISSHLEGVFGGMQSITEKLVRETGIEITGRSAETLEGTKIENGGTLKIHRKATVTELRKDESDENLIKVTLLPSHDDPPKLSFQRVIMALPTVPAEKLAQNSPGIWRNNPEKARFAGFLHSALPFQLVKVFFVVRDRWWEEDVRANLGATRYPTREVYFWKSRTKESRRGLVMLYTDRPAAAFWANYVPNPTQDDIDELCRAKLKDGASPEDRKNADLEADAVATLRARMKSRFVEYVNENEGVTITVDDIIWCGIMDWGREPYGAASHAWRPNREYWQTLATLGDWQLGATDRGPHLHVCGEAYSDYHAFIEGALRSAVHVLTLIRNKSECKMHRLASIINTLLEGRQEQVDFDKIENCIATEQGKALHGKEVDEASLTDDEKYIKDFFEFSSKLDDLN